MFIKKILTRFSPGMMPVSDWCDECMHLLDLREMTEKSRNKRKGNIKHLQKSIGHLRVSAVRPIHIATAVREIWTSGRQNTARRVLAEAREVFIEAVSAGLIKVSPATHIKPLPVKIRRQRMRLSEWQAIYTESLKTEPPWVPRMLMLALLTGQRRADLQKMKFADIQDGHVLIEQQKTGERIALPLNLRLDVIDTTLGQAIESCRNYAKPGPTLIRRQNGATLGNNYLTSRFRSLFVRVLNRTDTGYRPSLHECRSLSSRLYKEQGINAKVLLGHKNQAMTDVYLDDRGLDRGKYKYLSLESVHNNLDLGDLG